MNPHTIVIIGAGFSGVALVAQLARQARGRQLRLVLVNRSGSMARGLAYGTKSPDHLLNVPAGNMSALADQPAHFLHYARWREASIDSHSFVARSLYGDYLESLLAQAQDTPVAGLSLQRRQAEVREIHMRQGRRAVVLSDGETILADQVVLAFGHFPSPHPAPAGPSLISSPRYLRDPWNVPALSAIDADAPVLLIGTGLTAIDTCLSLLKSGPTRRITLLSRRGLLPKAHLTSQPVATPCPLPELFAKPGASVAALVKAMRRHLATSASQGHDWRDALNQLRPHTQQYWQSWSDIERRRFLRHVQPFWDNHRHRAAPAAHALFERALQSGQVSVQAGRIERIQASAHGITLELRVRGSTSKVLHSGYVINCIGPSSKLREANNPLVANLLEQGVLAPDALGLGVAVDANCRLLGRAGAVVPDMFYIGPLLKARYWEATAVPELRQFAARLAATLLAAS